SVYTQSDLMMNNDLSNYRFSLIFQVKYPVILLIIGIYLLKDGNSIGKLAFRNLNAENEDRIGLLFFLFMKLAGLVLIIYALPKAFQLLSHIMFISSVHGIDTSEQMKFVIQNIVT